MIVSFEEYVPPPRYDGQPFTDALIEEGPTSDGLWTLIDTVALVPVDADPSQPEPRNFTTENATAPDLWYRIGWRDSDGDTVYTEAIQNLPGDALEYEPTLRDIANHIRARLKDPNGNELSTFTPTTRPTDTQAREVAVMAANKISQVIGDDIPDALIPEAADVAALRAAMLIELTYYPEQIRSGRSPYPELKELYDEELEKLRLAVVGALEDGTVDVQPTPVDSNGNPILIQGGAYFNFEDRKLVGGMDW